MQISCKPKTLPQKIKKLRPRNYKKLKIAIKSTTPCAMAAGKKKTKNKYGKNRTLKNLQGE